MVQEQHTNRDMVYRALFDLITRVVNKTILTF